MLFEFVDFADARLTAAFAGFGLPSGIFWLYFSGSILLIILAGTVLVAAGLALIANKKARMAATCLGMMILLLVLFVYLPVLVASPTDIVSLNYFVDTLLFSGAALVLADALRDRTAAG